MAMKSSSARKERQVTLADIPRVGPGTPAGEWLRKYWLALSTAEELYDIPKAVKVLGEELVLFRDLHGRLGLVGLHCPHRGTSLEYGDVEENGIRCPYHGWLFDVSGQCLEQPAEPKDSVFCQKVKHLSYPVQELGGLIFAYLGPQPAPPLPRYSCLVDRGGMRQIEPVRTNDYNWFNFFENSADPCHICILHRHTGYGEQSWGDQFFSYTDMPDFDFVETDYGFKVVMTKPGPSAGTEFVDTMSLALPCIIQVGDTEFVHAKVDAVKLMTEGSHCDHVLFLTPNDDEHFTIFTVNYYTGSDPNFFEKLKALRATEVPKEAVKEYDRRMYMPFKGNVRQEDIMSQSTQGLLGEREERLATSDKGVIMFRRIIRDAIAAAQKGQRPKGVLPREKSAEVVFFDSFTGVRKAAAR
jgi:5,5'-dehydrodivanillate O-demethylase oxygenase subunit